METGKKRRGRPRKITSWSAAILQERSREYFDKCDSRQKEVPVKDGTVWIAEAAPYSIEGLCCYLDIARWTFDSWRKLENALGERARMIHQRITANRVEGALDGRQNASFARFMLANNDPQNYREKVEVENSVGEEVKTLLESVVGSWKNIGPRE